MSTLTGCHTAQGRRPANQDAVLAAVLPDGRQLVAVADGMGGHSAGEVASRAALEAVRDGLSRGLPLREAAVAANGAVHVAAQQNPAWAGMGTTLVALLHTGDQYEIVNVGDSRAYRVTPAAIRQVTADHSVMAEALSSGGMTAEEAQRSRWRHALTRALGTEAVVEVDLFGPFNAAEPHAVILCSDGLYRSVSKESLAGAVASSADAESLARALTDEAYRNGSNDNISAAVILFDAAPEPPLDSERLTRRRRFALTTSQCHPAPANPIAGIELALIVVLLTLVIVLLVRGL